MPSLSESRVRNAIVCFALARRLRKPVPEDLLGGEAGVFEPRPNSLGRLAMLAQIGLGKFCCNADFVLDQVANLAPQAGAVSQPIANLLPRFADRRPPSCARLRGRGLQVQELPRIRGICELNSRRWDFPKLSISSAKFSQSRRRFEPPCYSQVTAGGKLLARAAQRLAAWSNAGNLRRRVPSYRPSSFSSRETNVRGSARRCIRLLRAAPKPQQPARRSG
jgi:hypothetical protein